MSRDDELGNILSAEQIIEITDKGEHVVIPAFALKHFIAECEHKQLRCFLQMNIILTEGGQQVALISKLGTELKFNVDGTIDL